MSNRSYERKILLWGGRSKSRIISEMIGEFNLGQVEIVFDDTLASPMHSTEASFLNNANELRKQIGRVTHFVVCIGGHNGFARFETSRRLEEIGLSPLSIIHPSSFIDPTAILGTACQVMPLALVHKHVRIGENCILNTHSSIDHDTVIGDGTHVMGSAAITGQVTVAKFATIGTNATILPNIHIGEGAIVGAGAVVTKDVAPYSVVIGSPARIMRMTEPTFYSASLEILSAS